MEDVNVATYCVATLDGDGESLIKEGPFTRIACDRSKALAQLIKKGKALLTDRPQRLKRKRTEDACEVNALYFSDFLMVAASAASYYFFFIIFFYLNK